MRRAKRVRAPRQHSNLRPWKIPVLTIDPPSDSDSASRYGDLSDLCAASPTKAAPPTLDSDSASRYGDLSALCAASPTKAAPSTLDGSMSGLSSESEDYEDLTGYPVNLPSNEDVDCAEFGTTSSSCSEDCAGCDHSADGHSGDDGGGGARGTATGGYVDPTPRKLRGVKIPTPLLVEAMSDKNWTVSHHNDASSVSPWAYLTENRTNTKFCVLWKRVSKAKLHLTYDSCAETMKTSACECRKSCNTTFGGDVEMVRKLRQPLFENCPTSDDVKAHLSAKLIGTGNRCVLSVGVAGNRKLVPVCRKYYAAAHGVAVSVVKKCLAMGKSGVHTTRRYICVATANE